MSKSIHKPNVPVTAIILRSAFDGRADEFSDLTGVDFSRPAGLDDVEWSQHPNYSLTDQSQRDECDINTIVNRFLRDGILPDSTSRPQFGDFSAAPSNFQDALNLVMAANAAFAELPAHIRSRFDHDPVKYVNFFEDPKNRDEAIRLGLVNPPEPVDVGTALSNSAVGDDDDVDLAPSSKSSSKGAKK